jgi:integrase/recombinase XerD
VAGLELPFPDWPAEDRSRWEAAFKQGNWFDEGGLGAHLSVATRRVFKGSYARFLTFVAERYRDRLAPPPEQRIDRTILAEYVAWRRRHRPEIVLAVDLHHLRGAFRLICPESDWSWLLTIAKRISATARRKAPRYNLVTSERLYALGIQLMDQAEAAVDTAGEIHKGHAFQYRDGLMIALLTLIPLRLRTFVALRIGRHLVKSGDLWSLAIPAVDTKSRRPLDFPISQELSVRIERYFGCFRFRIPAADQHDGVWVSNRGRPISSNAVYAALVKRTKEAFGFAVNPHRFRHAAATFWSIHDPVNVRGVKDLLGQVSFGTTDSYYIMAHSRIAGRTVARIVDQLRK